MAVVLLVSLAGVYHTQTLALPIGRVPRPEHELWHAHLQEFVSQGQQFVVFAWRRVYSAPDAIA